MLSFFRFSFFLYVQRIEEKVGCATRLTMTNKTHVNYCDSYCHLFIDVTSEPIPPRFELVFLVNVHN